MFTYEDSYGRTIRINRYTENKLIIWGAGIRGRRVLESLQNIQCGTEGLWEEIFFCDTNKAKQGTDI